MGPRRQRPCAYRLGVKTFRSTDGTRLAYRQAGAGQPLICLPGGPMQHSAYLGDLGGLSATRPLVVPDPRGTGASEVPSDPGTYRCDRQVDDVEALRLHLGLARMDLAAHSAGASLAIHYATRYPHRVARLVLIAPSPRPVGLEIADADRREVAELRRAEAWFPEAFAAFERIWAGEPADADWDAITPFLYGRWDEHVRETHDRETGHRNNEAAAAFYGEGSPDPAAVRAALLELSAPVLVIAGEYDVALPPGRAAEFAGLFPHGGLSVLPAAGHNLWRDDPAHFVETVATFLDRAAG